MTPESIARAPLAAAQQRRPEHLVRADLYWHQAMFAAPTPESRARWLARAEEARREGEP